jgi:Zn-dependent protease with chaperone function
MFTFLGWTAVVLVFLRWYARRQEGGPGEAADRMHRIQRALVLAVLSWMPMMVLIMLEFRWEAPAVRLGTAGEAGGLIAFAIAWIAVMLMMYLATYPSTARLRGLRPEPARAVARAARMFSIIIIVPVTGVLLFVIGLKPLYQDRPWLFWPLAIGWLLLVFLTAPLALRAMLKTRPVGGQRRAWLMELCDRHGLRIKDVRVVDTGPERTANALFTGMGRGNRHIMITDRLFDELSPDELEAVVAHEIGHAKHHHLLIKLGVHLGVIAVVTAAFFGLTAIIDLGDLPAAPVMLVAFLTLMSVHGAVGIRLERTADDYAARTTDPAALARGLEKLAQANLARRRTGRIWSLMEQHPGLEQRLERLERIAAHR